MIRIRRFLKCWLGGAAGVSLLELSLLAIDLEAMDLICGVLIAGKPARSLMKSMSPDEKAVIRGFHLLTNKPVIYIANFAEDGFENNPLLDVVRAIAEEEGAMLVTVCN